MRSCLVHGLWIEDGTAGGRSGTLVLTDGKTCGAARHETEGGDRASVSGKDDYEICMKNRKRASSTEYCWVSRDSNPDSSAQYGARRPSIERSL